MLANGQMLSSAPNRRGVHLFVADLSYYHMERVDINNHLHIKEFIDRNSMRYQLTTIPYSVTPD